MILKVKWEYIKGCSIISLNAKKILSIRRHKATPEMQSSIFSDGKYQYNVRTLQKCIFKIKISEGRGIINPHPQFKFFQIVMQWDAFCWSIFMHRIWTAPKFKLMMMLLRSYLSDLVTAQGSKASKVKGLKAFI